MVAAVTILAWNEHLSLISSLISIKTRGLLCTSYNALQYELSVLTVSKFWCFYPQAFFDCWSEQIAKIFLQALHWDVAFWEKNPRFPPQIMYFSHCVCVHVRVCVRGVFHVVVADKQHTYLLNLITTELQTPVNWSISCCAPIQLTHTRTHAHTKCRAGRVGTDVLGNLYLLLICTACWCNLLALLNPPS